MASYLYRPLPVPPSYATGDYVRRDEVPKQYHAPYSYFPYTFSPFPTRSPVDDNPSVSANSQLGGTLLHRGFYDLLALIPSTPSPSRFFWGADQKEELVAGPKYNNVNSPPLPSKVSRPLPDIQPASPPIARKGRRISKDMVSKPTGFV